MTTLLVSDIHLGSPMSRARALLTVLKKLEFSRLILLGDVFADLNFSRLKKDHFQLLNYLRELSNPKRGIEVIWVIGNHDEGVVGVLAALVGVEVHEHYEWWWNGHPCLAIHGHQFDGVITHGKRMSAFFSFLFLEAQKLRFFRRHLSLLIDRISARWQRLTPLVAARALDYARARGARRVFCGHTHQVHHQAAGEIEYYNTGCWIGNSCCYIRMTEDEIEVVEVALPHSQEPSP